MVRWLLLLLSQSLGDWLDEGYEISHIDPSYNLGTLEHRYYVHDAERLRNREEVAIDSSAQHVASEQACMQSCDQEQTCDCAVFSKVKRTCQRWAGCQRHSDHLDDHLEKDWSSITLMKVPELTPEYTEYAHYGGNAMSIDRGGDPALVGDKQECQDRCTVDPACECSVWALDGTQRCWKERGCRPKDLSYSPLYTTFVKDPSHLVRIYTTTSTLQGQWVVVEDKETTTSVTTTTVTTRATTPTTSTSTTSTTTSRPECLLVTMTIAMPFPHNLTFVKKAFLEQTPKQAVHGLNHEMKSGLVEASLREALASSLNVEEGSVQMVGPLRGAEADDSLHLFVKSKVTIMDLSMDEYLELRRRFCPEGGPEKREMSKFLRKLKDTLQQDLAYKPGKLQHLLVLTPLLGHPQTRVLSSTCSRTEPPSFDLGAAVQSGVSAVQDGTGVVYNWLRHHSRLMLFLLLLLLLLLLIRAAMIYGPKGYQKLTGADSRTFRRTLAQRFESRSARISRVQGRVEKYAQRAFHMVMAAEPDFEDTELQYYVKVLNRCKGHAKVLCGSPWGPFQTPGECELCKRHIDRPEKGCQCTQGGHRLCWSCMVGIMNWETLASQEGQQPWTWSIKDWL